MIVNTFSNLAGGGGYELQVGDVLKTANIPGDEFIPLDGRTIDATNYSDFKSIYPAYLNITNLSGRTIQAYTSGGSSYAYANSTRILNGAVYFCWQDDDQTGRLWKANSMDDLSSFALIATQSRPSTSGASDSSFNDIAYGNGYYVAISQDYRTTDAESSTNYANIIARVSTDGTNFNNSLTIINATRGYSGGPAPFVRMNHIHYINGYFVGAATRYTNEVGSFSADNILMICNSDPTVSTNWQEVNIESGTWSNYTNRNNGIPVLTDISYINGMYLVTSGVPGSNVTATAAIYYSNSITGPFEKIEISGTTNINEICFYQGNYVICGSFGVKYNSNLSSDGWIDINIPSGYYGVTSMVPNTNSLVIFPNTTSYTSNYNLGVLIVKRLNSSPILTSSTRPSDYSTRALDNASISDDGNYLIATSLGEYSDNDTSYGAYFYYYNLNEITLPTIDTGIPGILEYIKVE